MNWHDKTIQTYDLSAAQLKEYFAGYGSRIEDIERAIALAGSGEKTRAIEIGCGDGRDAKEIVKRISFFEAFDPSIGLLEIAKSTLPNVSFTKADALNYRYPHNLNIVFAFASLLHVNQDDLHTVFNNVYDSLNTGSIFYISLKEAEQYTEKIKKDEYGERMFYLYNAEDIKAIAGSRFTTVYEDHYVRGNTDWFTIALKKV